VIRDNHIGDWGTQFGMVIYGWKNLLDRAALVRDPIAELVRIYKTANELTKNGSGSARGMPQRTRQSSSRWPGKPANLE
jgi:arginyl-tRNA synthetase